MGDVDGYCPEIERASLAPFVSVKSSREIDPPRQQIGAVMGGAA